MQHKADLTLVKRLLKGSEADFNRFYESYFPRVYRFCILRTPSESICQDVVQQTMGNAMRGLHTYKGEASLLTWLCQIARNDIAKWYKAHGDAYKRTVSLDHNPELQATLESMEVDLQGETVTQNDVKYLVQSALDQLPSAYGDALELKYIDGLSVNEIAAQLSMGEIAVQSLLARARKAFKQAMTELTAQSQAQKSGMHLV